MPFSFNKNAGNWRKLHKTLQIQAIKARDIKKTNCYSLLTVNDSEQNSDTTLIFNSNLLFICNIDSAEISEPRKLSTANIIATTGSWTTVNRLEANDPAFKQHISGKCFMYSVAHGKKKKKSGSDTVLLTYILWL